MEHTLAMQIFGVVMILVGIMKNWDPVGLNKSIFGEGEGVEGGFCRIDEDAHRRWFCRNWWTESLL